MGCHRRRLQERHGGPAEAAVPPDTGQGGTSAGNEQAGRSSLDLPCNTPTGPGVPNLHSWSCPEIGSTGEGLGSGRRHRGVSKARRHWRRRVWQRDSRTAGNPPRRQSPILVLWRRLHAGGPDRIPQSSAKSHRGRIAEVHRPEGASRVGRLRRPQKKHLTPKQAREWRVGLSHLGARWCCSKDRVLSANLRNQAGRCWRRVHASLSLARRRCKGASLRLTSSTEKASGSKSSPIHSRNSSYRLWSGSLRASSWFALEVRRNDLTLLR